MQSKKIGLILSGGGARGAYQAGALKAVSEISEKIGIKSPFSILSGISIGAINSAFIASYAHNIPLASSKLIETWNNLRTNKIIRTGKIIIGKKAARMLLELTSGKMIKHKKSRSLLDNAPLSEFLHKEINFQQIHKNIQKGVLDSLAITAVNYTDGKNYIFFETNQNIEPWIRERRVVLETKITLDHVLASSAIPLYFPPHKIGDHYYADGNIRNSTPLSPPIRLGAEKLLVITLKEPGSTKENTVIAPSMGRMISVLLNALLLDAVDFDYERLSRINETLNYVSDYANTPLKKIEVCMIRPSEDIAQISHEYLDNIPSALRFFLEGLGSTEESGGLISTLLFEPPYIKRLIQLGYQDAMNKKEEIIEFFRK